MPTTTSLWLHCPTCRRLLGKYDPSLDRVVVVSAGTEVRALPGSERRCSGCGELHTLERPA